MIRDFLTYLQYEKNRSSHTVLSYKNDIESFQKFLSEHLGKQNCLVAQTDDVRLWIVFLLKEEKQTSRSVNRKISALNTLYNYMIRNGKLQENPMRKITTLKSPKKLPEFFKQESVEAASEEFDGCDDFVSAQSKLVIDLLYETGIRRGELVNLKESDVNIYNNVIKVVGKGNKERQIPFGDTLKEEILSFMKMKEEMIGKTEYLFCRSDGTQTYPMMIYRIVHNEMKKHSTLNKCSPHVLRHTFATTLLNEGADIRAVEGLLGHASLAATQVYTHVTFEQLQKIYNHAHPREHKKQ